MSNVPRTIFTLIVAFVCAGAAGAQGKKPNPIYEQTIFSGEESFQHPVSLSPAVLKVLLKTKAAKEGLAFASDSERSNPAQLFRAAAVHLSRTDDIDFVVRGIDWMSGADNDWFWIVRSAHTQPRVVLFVGGNSIELMRTRTNGYCNIRSDWSSPQETRDAVYHFDGRKYKLWKEKWTPNQ